MIPTLILNNSVVEVIENLFLDHQPYLLRLNTWGQKVEIRISAKELKQLGEFLGSFVLEYNDDDDTQTEEVIY